jgi:hypothetical protein
MGTRTGEEPTEKELKRDMNALLRNRKDGKIVVENIKPKTTSGSRTVIDETFKDSIQIKKTDEKDIEG